MKLKGQPTHLPVHRPPHLATMPATSAACLPQGGYTQAALLFITLPIYLLKFDT